MIPISSTSPVSWPTPPSAAVAPVSATTPVKPAASGGQEPQADVQTRREPRNTPERTGGTGEGAPALPRSGQADVRNDSASPPARQQAAERAEQGLKKAETEKASHKKAMERLQDVLASMWAASAAVVDQALGRTAQVDELPGNQSDTAPDLSAVAASTMSRRQASRLADAAPGAEQPERPAVPDMPWPVMPDTGEEAAAPGAPAVPGGEVIAYDENGNSSLAPLEAGTLLSEKA